MGIADCNNSLSLRSSIKQHQIAGNKIRAIWSSWMFCSSMFVCVWCLPQSWLLLHWLIIFIPISASSSSSSSSLSSFLSLALSFVAVAVGLFCLLLLRRWGADAGLDDMWDRAARSGHEVLANFDVLRFVWRLLRWLLLIQVTVRAKSFVKLRVESLERTGATIVVTFLVRLNLLRSNLPFCQYWKLNPLRLDRQDALSIFSLRDHVSSLLQQSPARCFVDTAIMEIGHRIKIRGRHRRPLQCCLKPAEPEVAHQAPTNERRRHQGAADRGW